MTRRIAVFASGGGSNLQSLLDHFATSAIARVALVVSNRADAGAVGRARAAEVPVHIIETTGRTEDAVAHHTLTALQEADIDVVALAGYLKLIPAAVVDGFRGRMVNVHPALLPAFGGPGMYGRHVHRAVLAAGVRVTGVTVHHVDTRYDEGHAIAQWPVPVLPHDTPETLAARVLRAEHIVYPCAVEALCRQLDGATFDTPEFAFNASPNEALSPRAVRGALGLPLEE